MEINFLQEKDLGIEFVICKSSLISYPIHNHVSVFTVGVLLDGAIDLTIGKITNTYRNNETFLIPPYVPHKIAAYGKYTLLCCCINKNIIATLPLHVLKIVIASLLNKALSPNDVSTDQSALLIASLDVVQKSYQTIKFSEVYLEKLIRQIELFPERQVYIDDMVKIAYLSKYYFIRKFKEEIGLTPHQFILQNRTRKAQHLLTTYDTITEVALTMGFCDQSHFIRNFEKILGMTPTVYKMAYIPISLAPVN